MKAVASIDASRRLGWAVVAAVACVFAIAIAPGTALAGLPAGLNDSVVYTGLNLPVSIRFAPDGHVFVAQKGGQILAYDSLTDTSPTVVADLSPNVHDYWDRGLLGIAVDPGWPVSPYIYALYTVDARVGVTSGEGTPWGDDCPSPPGGDLDGCTARSRLVRLTIQGSPLAVTDTKTLIDNEWCVQFQTHSIGDLHFGPDGALYASGGDGAEYHGVDYGQLGGSIGSPTKRNPCGDPPGGLGTALTPPSSEGGALRSQSLRRPAGEPRLLNGTVIRINPSTGDALPDNPLSFSSSANERRVIASGLRNPFRFAFRPDPANPGQLLRDVWVGDVGWAKWEEINRIPSSTSAPNFGWPCYEGAGPQAEYQGLGLTMCNQLYSSGQATAPVFTYEHDQKVNAGDTCTGNSNNTPFGNGGGSVTGIAFYQGTSYPAKYNNALLFADYSRNCIWAMLPGANGVPDPTKVETFETGAPAPVGLEAGPNGDIFYPDIVDGNIHRISGSAPTAVAKATTPPFGPLNLAVSFDGTQSSSPAGHSLSYSWDLNGDGLYGDSTLATPTRTYTSAGQFDVRLKVTDTTTGTVSSPSTPIRVVPGGSPPTVTSFSPQSSLTWKVGDTIPFAATVTDTQDGTLTGSSLAWSIELRHCNLANTACHSHFLPSATGASGSFLAPDHEYPSHLELTLTATDSSGLKTTRTVSLDPQLATFQMRSSPSGAQLTIGSNTLSTPFDISTIVGSSNSLNAPSPQVFGGAGYLFGSWSDGGAQSHAVVAGPSTTTYTATYTLSSDLALGKVASASSVEPPDQYNGMGVFTAAKAVDGDASTRWSSSYADNQWWQVDLGSAQQVSSVSIVWEAAFASSYKIQVSTDGSSFTDVASVSLAAAGLKSTSFSAVSARYVRVLALTRATPYGFSFFTAQVFGPGGGGGGVPVNTGLPVVSGSAVQGQTLSASTGSWTNAPSSYAYVWRRCDAGGAGCVNISGASSASYLVVAGDVGSTLRVVVTASNGSGPSTPASSAQTAVVTGSGAGSDLALGKVASASSVEPPDQYNGMGVFTAAKAVDGDASTRWSSSYADNQWWQVDLGSAQQVSSVSIVWEAAFASSYKIQVSTDGSSFTDVASVSLAAAGLKSTSFSAVSARYVRVLALTRATPYGFSFFTAQVFGPGGGGGGVPVNTGLPVVSGSAVQGQTLSASTGSWTNAPSSYAYVWRRCDAGGAGCVNISGASSASYLVVAGDVGSTLRVVVTASNGSGPSTPASSAQTAVVTGSGAGSDLALGKVASASSVEPPDQYNGMGVFTAAKAVDGDASTRWSSSYADNQWWQVDLGSAQQVSSVSIVWEAAFASSYKIQVSTDGSSFTDVASVSLAAAGLKSTSFSAVSARYVRVLALTRATPYGFSFFTAQVFGPGGGGGGVPVNTGLPVVSGSAVQGQTLSASTGSWTNAPSSYAYVWRRCDAGGAGCVNISGASSASYLVVAGDVGSTLRVVVTASNGSGPSTPASSAQTAVVTGSGAGSDLALGKVASASSVEPPDQYNGMGVFTAAKAVDGDASTRWSSSYADNQWWQVDLGSAQQVSSVSIVWEAAFASSYKIQVSTDGSSFTDVASVSLAAAGLKSTSFSAVSARYVRVLALTRATPYGFSFFTAQVFGP